MADVYKAQESHIEYFVYAKLRQRWVSWHCGWAKKVSSIISPSKRCCFRKIF